MYNPLIASFRSGTFVLATCWVMGVVFSLPAYSQQRAIAANFSPAKTYLIGSNSVLKVDGKTNVNSFSCDCKEDFPAQTFIIDGQDLAERTTTFKQTRLSFKIKSLDCGNKMMNKDLQKALNAGEYPSITIELLKVKEDRCNQLTELKDWVKLKALTKISLNGRSNDYWIDITAKKNPGNSFRFIGSRKFCMSDFGVTPPEAFMGMVKVKDEIKINLDLEVIID